MSLTILSIGAQGDYDDATGVIDGTAAAEVVALVAILKTFIPAAPSAYAAGAGTPVGAISEQPMPHTGFDKMPKDLAVLLLKEIDAFAAAIAAAPTS